MEWFNSGHKWSKAELLEKLREQLELYDDDVLFYANHDLSDDCNAFGMQAIRCDAPDLVEFSHQELISDPETGKPYYITVTEYLEKRK